MSEVDLAQLYDQYTYLSHSDRESMYNTVMLGADVEFFFRDSSGNLVSADDRLPAKRNALSVQSHSRGCIAHATGEIDDDEVSYTNGVTLHFDGIQGEATIVETFCRAYGIDRLRDGLRGAYEIARKHGDTLSLESAVEVPPDVLFNASEEAIEFGCDPDFTAWLEGQMNTSCINPYEHPIRYAGSHIHVGYGAYRRHGLPPKKVKELLTDKKNQLLIIKAMDILIGNMFVMFEADDPSAVLRRKLYGAAGCYRPTSYGVEYRTLGAYVMSHPSLYSLAWKLARGVTSLVIHDRVDELIEAVDPVEVIMAINNVDADLAKDNFKKVLGLSIWKHAGQDLNIKDMEAVEAIVENGPDKYFRDGTDYIRDNWCLDVDHVFEHCECYETGDYLIANIQDVA